MVEVVPQVEQILGCSAVQGEITAVSFEKKETIETDLAGFISKSLNDLKRGKKFQYD